MSRGPGIIENRIAELLAATRDRALDIGEITRHAFALGDKTPTRPQRLSATRATHRLLRRVRETHERAREVMQQAHANTQAALGREERKQKEVLDKEYLGPISRGSCVSSCSQAARLLRAHRQLVSP